ncbi:MAG: hypothetical protein IT462_14060 [Planctomycetes bacterium]|nr:hypothetical protein [Planctomycetota bacterium]
MEQLSEEDLEKILRELQEAEALEGLKEGLEGCKRGMGQGGEDGEAERMRARMRATLRALARRAQGGRPGAGNEPGPDHGEASGGQAKKGPDDGRPEDPSMVKGALDPKGRMGKNVEFRGMPKPGETKAGFAEVVRAAVDDAEDSLKQDEIPPDARPLVRRYFESLKDR